MKPLRLGDIVLFVRNGKSVKQGSWQGGLPISRIETIADGEINADKVGFADLGVEGNEEWLLKDGDILISHINSTKHLGKCAQYNGHPVQLIHGMNLLNLRCDQQKAFPRYVLHFLKSEAFLRQIPRITKNSVNQSSFTVSAFKELIINLPSLPEQKRIAAILDKADAIRRKREKAIELTDSFSRSVFLEMFGEPIFNTKGWNKAPLETLCIKVVDCPHSTPQWQPAGKVCIRTSNLTKGGWDWSDTRYVSEQDFESRSRRAEVEAGDIILSREGTVGIAAIVEEGMSICMGQRLVQLRVNPKFLTSPYLLHLLLYELAPHRIERLMAGSTSKHLNVRDLRNLLVPTPPLHLQEKFAKVCKTTSRLSRKASQSLTLSNQLVASLSTNVLTSRVQQSEPDLLREEAYAL